MAHKSGCPNSYAKIVKTQKKSYFFEKSDFYATFSLTFMAHKSGCPTSYAKIFKEIFGKI